MSRKSEPDKNLQAQIASARHWLAKSLKKLWPLALTAIVTFLVGAFDVLGLHSNLEGLSQRVAQHTLAPLHGATAGQKDVSVVLIDNDFYGSFHHRPGWPLPVNVFMRKVMDPIVAAHPAAIFIDLSFTDLPRAMTLGGTPNSRDAVKAEGAELRQSSQTVPIFVADVIAADSIAQSDDATCPLDWLAPQNVAANRTTSAAFIDGAFPQGAPPSGLEIVPVNWTGSSERYPLGSMIMSPPGDCQNLIRSLDEIVRSGKPPQVMRDERYGYLATPAAALLVAVCERQWKLVAAPDVSLCPQIRRIAPADGSGLAVYGFGPSAQTPVAVQWGSHLSRIMRRHFVTAEGSDRCAPQFGSPIAEEARQFAIAFLPSVFEWLFPGGEQRGCAFIDTLSAADLMGHGAPGSRNSAENIAKDFLKDRIVMIGTDLPFVPDTIASPVNGQMPGVYIHAAALENLLSDGSSYPRAPEGMGKILEALVEAIVVALLSWATGRFFASPKVARVLPIAESIDGVATFIGVWIVLCLLIFAAALAVSGLLGLASHRIYFGSPIYIALAASVVMTEEARHHFFSRSHDRKEHRRNQ